MNEKKDKEIIQAVLAGRVDQFEEIMKRYNEQFYRIAIAYVKDPLDAEDAMQSAYLKIFEKLYTFQGDASFSTWMIRILINECKMMMRQKRNAFQILSQFSKNLMQRSTRQTTESSLINKELNLFIERTIMGIPQKYRVVFIFREINGFSIKETAEHLELSESNVKVRLHRAKELIKDKMLQANNHNALFDFHAQRCNPFRDRVMKIIKAKTISL